MNSTRYQRIRDEESGNLEENAIELTESEAGTSREGIVVSNALHSTKATLSVRILFKEKVYVLENIKLEFKVSQLKEMIKGVTDVPPNRQRLVMNGKLLKPDDSTLENFNVQNLCSIHVFPLPEAVGVSSSSTSSAPIAATNVTPLFHPTTTPHNTHNTHPTIQEDDSIETSSRELRWWCAILLILSVYTLMNNFSYFSATGHLGSGGLDSIVFIIDTICSCLGIWVANMGFRSVQTLDIQLVNKYVYWLGVLMAGCIVLRLLWVVDVLVIMEHMATTTNTDTSNNNNDNNDNNNGGENGINGNNGDNNSSGSGGGAKKEAPDLLSVGIQASMIAAGIIYSWMSCYWRARLFQNTLVATNRPTATTDTTTTTPAIATATATTATASSNSTNTVVATALPLPLSLPPSAPIMVV